jgi:hypothetical protein
MRHLFSGCILAQDDLRRATVASFRSFVYAESRLFFVVRVES